MKVNLLLHHILKNYEWWTQNLLVHSDKVCFNKCSVTLEGSFISRNRRLEQQKFHNWSVQTLEILTTCTDLAFLLEWVNKLLIHGQLQSCGKASGLVKKKLVGVKSGRKLLDLSGEESRRSLWKRIKTNSRFLASFWDKDSEKKTILKGPWNNVQCSWNVLLFIEKVHVRAKKSADEKTTCLLIGIRLLSCNAKKLWLLSLIYVII